MERMERREFFRSLGGIAAIARPANKNRKAHHKNDVLYHGPIRIPEDVLDIASRAPVYRTTHGAKKLAIRLALDGVTYLFRTGLAGDCYLGEIIRTPEGMVRVHVWTAIESAPNLADILRRKMEHQRVDEAVLPLEELPAGLMEVTQSDRSNLRPGV